MNFADYKIANVTDKSEIRERLARVEEDLSKEMNKQIILIAYQKDENSTNQM